MWSPDPWCVAPTMPRKGHVLARIDSPPPPPPPPRPPPPPPPHPPLSLAPLPQRSPAHRRRGPPARVRPALARDPHAHPPPPGRVPPLGRVAPPVEPEGPTPAPQPLF